MQMAATKNAKSSESNNSNCNENRKKINFLFCFIRNAVCGSLQCKDGDRQPNVEGYQLSSKTIISIKGMEYECKWVYQIHL